ncbi:hypothetical protein DL93DRAFT_2064895, partial [Clavulina sp. PMI_390]
RQAAAQNAAAAARGVPLEQIARRKKRHLEELERSNYTEPKFSITGEEVKEDGGGTAKDRMRSTISDQQRQSSTSIRNILLYRKNLSTLVDDLASSSRKSDEPSYITAVAPPPSTPRQPFCSVCGYWGKYSCQKCGMHYCQLSCQSTHQETRCERRVL